MKTKDELLKMAERVIRWSEEDKTYVGSAFPIVGPCCHGDSVQDVERQLEEIIDDVTGDILAGKVKLQEASAACMMPQVHLSNFVELIEAAGMRLVICPSHSMHVFHQSHETDYHSSIENSLASILSRHSFKSNLSPAVAPERTKQLSKR